MTFYSWSFSGIFDGNGYTVGGIYITDANTNQGLFGYTSGATIQNVGIINSSISATTNVGAVVGNATNGSTVQYCYNTSNVSGTSSAGGIVGTLGTTDAADNATVANCYNTGTVTGGGIVGTVQSGTVRQCYHIGNATAPIVSEKGDAGTVSCCYYDASIATSVTAVEGVTALTTEQMTGTTDNDSTEDSTNRAQDSMTDFDAAVWTFTEDYHHDGTAYKTCYYPVLTSNKQDPIPSTTAQVTTVESWAKAASLAGNGTDYVLDDTNKTLKINTVYGLAWFANQVSVAKNNYSGYTVTLKNDIDLTDANVVGYSADDIAAGGTNGWTVIGTAYAYRFAGTFDGNDKTISGVYVNATSSNQGLFGFVFNATIKNLTLSDSQINGGNKTAGIVGEANNSTTISNCTTTQSVTVTSTGYYVGGVVGYAPGTISDCTNYGVVYSTSYNVGGIVGYADNATISNCTNDGEVTGTYAIGGIVGYTNTSAISACTNHGAVNGNNRIGGILGDTNAQTTVSNSYNTGDITATGNYAGGILGMSTYSYSSSTSMQSITNCYNTGTITGASYVAGILGANGESANTYVSITDCYNVGAITGTSSSALTGGIAVMYSASDTAYISNTNCYYNSELSGVSVGICNYTGSNHVPTALTTAQMTGTLAADANAEGNSMTFSGGNSDWNYTANTTVVDIPYYYYPTLVANAQDPAPYTSKLPASITVSMAGWTYGDAASDPSSNVTAGDGTTIAYNYYSDAACTTEITKPAAAGTYYITATVETTATYLAATSEAVAFTIAPLSVSVSWVVASSYTYTGSAFTMPAATITGAYDEGNISLTVTEDADQTFQAAGEYAFTASTTNTNYTLTNTTQSVTVGAASNLINDLSIDGWIYGEYNSTENAPSATASFGTIAYTYSTSENGTYTSAVPTTVGAYYVKASVTATANYAGAEAVTSFAIAQKDLTGNASVSIQTIDAVTYTGSAITPEPTVTYGSGASAVVLVKGTDYTLGYERNTNAGTATVNITYIGNYTGTASATFTINQVAASALAVSGITSEVRYTGSAYTPEPVVSYGSGDAAITLVKGTDYTLGYESNTNAGTATVTIALQGNYTGTLTPTFTIQQATPTVTVAAYKVEPTVAQVVLNAITFGLLGDYEDSYRITVTVIGVNGEAPTGTANIMNGTTVIASDVTVTNGVATYEWASVTPAQYTLTAEFAATEPSNYTDATSSEAYYEIGKATQSISISQVTGVTYGDADFTLAINDVKDSASLSYEVTSGTAVEIDSTSGTVKILSAGEITITVTAAATDNYNSASETVTFTVGKKEITEDDFAFALTGHIYTGAAIDVVTSSALTLNTDYTVSYDDNVNAGAVEVTVAGTGNYDGCIEKTFTIAQKQLTVAGSTASDKIYDGATTATVTLGTVSGVATTDSITVTAEGTFADKNAETDKSVTVTYQVDDDNYIAPVTDTVTATIAAKQLTVSGTYASNKTYDGATDATVTLGTVDGVVTGDSVEITAVGAFVDGNVGTGKTVNLAYSLTNSNYIAPVNGTTTGDITAKELIVTPSTLSKYYGENDDLLTYSYTGNVSGDTPAFTGLLSRQTGESIGTYTVTQGTLALADSETNYSLTLVDTVVYTICEYTTDAVVTPFTEWQNTAQIILNAPTGYAISLTNGVTDAFATAVNVDTINQADAQVTYYLRSTTGDDNGAISTANTFTYSNDQLNPSGTIGIGTSLWDQFLETITFGLYQAADVKVTITSAAQMH